MKVDYSGRRERREVNKGAITVPLPKPKPGLSFKPKIIRKPTSWKSEAEAEFASEEIPELLSFTFVCANTRIVIRASNIMAAWRALHFYVKTELLSEFTLVEDEEN